MCICGKGHSNNLSCKLYMNPLTIQEIVDLLAKQGYRANVTEEEGTGYVRITSYEISIPQSVRDMIEASLPAGVKASWSTDAHKKIPLPKSLHKWASMLPKGLK